MASPAKYLCGTSNLEPDVLLQTKTKDFISLVPKAYFDYIKTQFLASDRQNLEQFGLTVDDLFLMDRIYLQSSAIPYFQTRGLARAHKSLVSKMNTSDQNIFVNSTPVRAEAHSHNGFQSERNLVRKDKYAKINGYQSHHLSNASFVQENSNGYGTQNAVPDRPNSRTNSLQRKLPMQEDSVKTNNSTSPYGRSCNHRNNSRNLFESVKVQNNTTASSADEGSVSSISDRIMMDVSNLPVEHKTLKRPEDSPSIITNRGHPHQPVVMVSDILSPDTSKENIIRPIPVKHSQPADVSPAPTLAGSLKKPEDFRSMIGNIGHPQQPVAMVSDVQSSDISKEHIIRPIPVKHAQPANASPAPDVAESYIPPARAKPPPAESEGDSYEVVFGDKVQSAYLVIKQSDVASLEFTQSKLRQERLQPWSDQSEEKKVVVVVDSKHYRGMIVQNNIREIKGPSCVKLVDVGWFLPLDNQEMYVLPDSFKSMKPLAFPVNIGTSKHIARCSRATVVDTGMFNEKVRSVIVKRMHPASDVQPVVNKDVTVTEGGQKDIAQEPKISQTRETPKPVCENSCAKTNSELRPTADILKMKQEIHIVWLQRDEISDDIHWVQDVGYYQLYDSWQNVGKVQNHLTQMPQLGDVCFKITDDEWCRAAIIALQPLTVFYIDFGSSEVASSFEELKHIPQEISAYKPLAYKIKFYASENNEAEYNFGDRFKITPIHLASDIYVVLKDDEECPAAFDQSKVPAPQVRKTQDTMSSQPVPSLIPNQPSGNIPNQQVLDCKYVNASITQNAIELNKPMEVSYIQVDQVNPQLSWVQDIELASDMTRWQEIVDQFNVPFLPNSTQPGDFCVKLYEDVWCRAKVVSCNPLTLFYIDYGNEEIVEDVSQVKPLPEKLSHCKPLAIKVRFYYESNVPLEFGNVLIITPIEVKDDVYIVLKDGENIQPPESTLVTPSPQIASVPVSTVRYYFENSAINERSLLDLNKPVDVVFVQDDPANPSHKWVQEVQIGNFLLKWDEICTEHSGAFIQTPSVGEYCISNSEELWCRAKIVNVEPLTVFYVDYGNSEILTNISEIKPLPAELSTVKPMAHCIQFDSKTSAEIAYSFGDMFKITPIEVRDEVLVVLKDDEVVNSVVSNVYQSPVPRLALNQPCQASYIQEDEFDPQYTWAQDMTHFDKMGIFIQAMSEADVKFTQTPQLGDLCGKLFDEIWCRAKVVSLNPLTIFYIDYGNVEQVGLDDLKLLPSSISEYPGFAFRAKFLNGKPELGFGDPFTFTPVSLDDNVYTVTVDEIQHVV